MAAPRVMLHLDPVRSAANLLTLIEALSRDPGVSYRSYEQILDRIRVDYEYTGRTEPLSLARLLGLLVEADGQLNLSSTAQAIQALRPANRAEVMHFLLLTSWTEPDGQGLELGWAYRTFCARLWERGTVHLTSSEVSSAVADLLSAAQEKFLAHQIAFSSKSILGMRRWLEELDPPVMDGEVFRRREVCSRELLLLALGQVAREDGAELGADLLLTPERRKAICRICLLEPAALDRRLDHMLPSFPRLVAPGTRTGAYGRFVRLLAHPEITSLVG